MRFGISSHKMAMIPQKEKLLGQKPDRILVEKGPALGSFKDDPQKRTVPFELVHSPLWNRATMGSEKRFEVGLMGQKVVTRTSFDSGDQK